VSRSPHVVIGFHSWGLVSSKFAYALARACAYEGGRIASCIEIQSPYTDDARNRIVDRFLSMKPGPEYLMMVDGDIEFEKDAISKTMWIAQHYDADVVWGNYSLGSFSNSLFAKDETTELAIGLENLNPDKVYEGIYGGGTGWCLMNRRLLTEMKEQFPGPWYWFDRDVVKGAEGEDIKLGEDLSFGRRAWKMNAKQVGYTGVFLIHHKMHPTAPQFMQGIAAQAGMGMTNALSGEEVRAKESKVDG
jgi:hypothetical protein